MTVVDSSVVVDVLLATGRTRDLELLLGGEPTLAAPDVLVFEVLAALRRLASRGTISEDRARAAVEDLGDAPIQLFPSLPLRHRAWELRDNMTVADALFAVLAEQLDEPLLTKDQALASAAKKHLGIEVVTP